MQVWATWPSLFLASVSFCPLLPRVLSVYAQGHKTRPPTSLGPEMPMTMLFSSLIEFNSSRLLSPPYCRQLWPESFVPSSYAPLWKLIKGEVWAEATPCQGTQLASCEAWISIQIPPETLIEGCTEQPAIKAPPRLHLTALQIFNSPSNTCPVAACWGKRTVC